MENTKRAWFRGEPSVEELLSDPIMDLLMRYDGLTVDNFWTNVELAQSRLRAGPKDDSAA